MISLGDGGYTTGTSEFAVVASNGCLTIFSMEQALRAIAE